MRETMEDKEYINEDYDAIEWEEPIADEYDNYMIDFVESIDFDY